MTWFTTSDLDEFLGAAGAFLKARPADHTILLTITEGLRLGGRGRYGDDPWFGWWRNGAGVASAFVQTPPHPLVLSDVPEEARESLMDILAGVDQINAERGVGEAMAALGAPSTVRTRLRLYRLDELTPPQPAPPGRARWAQPADRDLLLSWYDLFLREVGEPEANVASLVDERLEYGGLMLWEFDGTPVAMAGRTRPMAGMVRIGPVFTPRELRGRGYAGGATASLSQAAQAMAEEVLLFTDLANATSNALYIRLGYRAVHDRMVLARNPSI